MLTTEELLLLLVNDEGKDEAWGTYRAYGLAGALITDLILAQRLTLDDGKDPKISLVAGPPTGNAILDYGLERLADKDGKRLGGMITGGRLKPENLVAESLADAGIIEIEEKRMLGFIPVRYPMRDPAPEQAVRARLAAVLAGQSTGSPQDLALLAILQGLGAAHKVLKAEAGGASKRELKARIEELVEHHPAGDAVARSVSAMNAAMASAVIIPVVVSGS